MHRHTGEFYIADPLSVNADHQEVRVIHTDPFGSYTGRPADPEDLPIQDADDL